MAELADAPDLGSGGQPCRFDSCYPHHYFSPRALISEGNGNRSGAGVNDAPVARQSRSGPSAQVARESIPVTRTTIFRPVLLFAPPRTGAFVTCKDPERDLGSFFRQRQPQGQSFVGRQQPQGRRFVGRRQPQGRRFVGRRQQPQGAPARFFAWEAEADISSC